MSGSNAISGIAVVGAILAAEIADGWFANTMAVIAIAVAMINVIGGFMVTNRMLSMFKSKPAKGVNSEG
jgi:NAD(P) transhydrogenase subunit alpha